MIAYSYKIGFHPRANVQDEVAQRLLLPPPNCVRGAMTMARLFRVIIFSDGVEFVPTQRYFIGRRTRTD
jgi:hypothetical protein